MSKNSGSQFEREISKRLSLWWSNNENDGIFWRSTASGARFTQRQKKGKDLLNQGGDITFTDECGKDLIKVFNIELKKGYAKKQTKVKTSNWCLLDVLDSKQHEPLIMSFWGQTDRDAQLTNRLPLLIFKRPSRTACIVLTQTLMLKLKVHFNYPDEYIIYRNTKKSLIVMTLDNFFTWIPDIRPFLKEYLDKQE